MALYVGIVQLRDGDYFGHTLNRVARLCAAGHGGQALLSNASPNMRLSGCSSNAPRPYAVTSPSQTRTPLPSAGYGS
jgi:hypothetical protein